MALMPAHEMQALAEARSHGHWFLGDIYLSRPDAAWITKLLQKLPADGETGEGLHALRSTLHAADPQQLAVEYTRLFRGIKAGYGPPPPYESLYREGCLMGQVTIDVLKAYTHAGYGQIDPAAGPQDHLGVELKFMGLLCHDEARAWGKDDALQAQRLQHMQTEFLDRHLLCWTPGYCQDIHKESYKDFYRHAATVTEQTLCEERELLTQLAV
ncbi:MAG: hypothetical protein BMS9Abin08_0598 [Gammaproteobacteria bacterium]|nr:MAG: hypothetical protein BMS9Abin08_0598 [Gammaproteobacteria bacterium]